MALMNKVNLVAVVVVVAYSLLLVNTDDLVAVEIYLI